MQTLSEFMNIPRKSHLNVAFRVLRHLKQNPGMGVSISKIEGLRSITGYYFIFFVW